MTTIISFSVLSRRVPPVKTLPSLSTHNLNQGLFKTTTSVLCSLFFLKQTAEVFGSANRRVIVTQNLCFLKQKRVYDSVCINMGSSEVTKKQKIGAHCALVFTQSNSFLSIERSNENTTSFSYALLFFLIIIFIRFLIFLAMGVIMYIFGKHALGSIPFFTFIVAR